MVISPDQRMLAPKPTRMLLKVALRLSLFCAFTLVGLLIWVQEASADGPETLAQMEKLWWSAGNTDSGVPYDNDIAWWYPYGDWSQGGVDCSSYIGKVWQVRRVNDPRNNPPDRINTTTLKCFNDYWYQVSRDLNSMQIGDVLVKDEDCVPSVDGSDHAMIYGWGDPCIGCQFAVLEATVSDGYSRVVHRSRTADGFYVAKRRNNLTAPGLVGRGESTSDPYNGTLHQPIVDAFDRNGEIGPVGEIRDNGGGFLIHRWGSGYVQDFDGGSGGTGALMQADSNSSMSYWIHGSIWDWYVKERGAVGWLGYPTSDEGPQTNFCDSSQPRSNLGGGYITYDNCQKGRWRSFTNNGRVPLHRYYIPGTGKQFFADNYYEGDIQNGSHEGIMGHMRPNLVGGARALYRWFAPSNNDHLYTDNPYEQPGGYNYEGIEGYVYQSGGGGFYPIHRLYSPYSGEHFLTNSNEEKTYLVSLGWSYEGVMGYLSSAP